MCRSNGISAYYQPFRTLTAGSRTVVAYLHTRINAFIRQLTPRCHLTAYCSSAYYIHMKPIFRRTPTERAIHAREGGESMEEKPTTKLPNNWRQEPPRMTSKDLRQRGKIGVTLTTDELHHVAHLLKVGKIMSNDPRSVSKNLRAAMTKLGVDTTGL